MNPVNKQTLIEYIESESGMNIPEWLRNAILSAPEVTTCKGCKHHEEAEGGYEYCHKWLRETYSDWYCSRGEQDDKG